VGVRASYLSGQRLPQILDSFIAEHPLAREKLASGEAVAVMKGAVPAGGSPQAIAKGNLLLAGDAAGQVMATSGGGIPLAIVGGWIAGQAAAAYLRGEERLEDYPSRINREFGIQLSRSVQIRKMVDLAMKSDRLMNSLFSALSPAQMKSVMRAQIPEIIRSREWTGDKQDRQS
jgi:digeranylgeranylglycerophospholipid reductase